MSATQYLIARLCLLASDIFSEGFPKMLDSEGRKCYPGVCPGGWAGPRRRFSLFCCELVPSPTRESLPPVPARPNRRPKCAQESRAWRKFALAKTFFLGNPFIWQGANGPNPRLEKAGQQFLNKPPSREPRS